MTRRLQKEVSQLVDPNENRLAGVLGLTETVIQVTRRPGYVWVRMLDNLSEAVQAYNRNVSPKFDLPVWLSYDGVKYTVEGINANRYSDWENEGAYLPNHGMQHSAMYGASGDDIVWVDQRQFLPLLPTPYGVTGSPIINVSPYVYQNSNGDFIWAGNTGIYIPPSPTASGSVLQLVMMRDLDGQLYTRQGPVFTGQISGANGYIPYLPTGSPANNNDIPIVAVRRTGNITGSPLLWENLVDVRQFYTGHVAAPTGSYRYLETIGVYNSGTFVGNVKNIDFYDNYTVSKVGDTAKIRYIDPGSAAPYIAVQDVSGLVTGTNITRLVVPNGSLAITGTTAYLYDPYVIVTEDLTYQISGTNSHFSTFLEMLSIPHVTGNLRQRPQDVIPDTDMRGFTLLYTPTLNDVLLVDYKTTLDHVVHYNGSPVIFNGGYILWS